MPAPMTSKAIEARKPVVFVIDDDQALRGALAFALELEGFAVSDFASGGDCLAAGVLPPSGCLVIDYKLPDMTGLDLLDMLRRRGVSLPAILITSHPSESLRRSAAAASLPIVEKPLLGDSLLDAIRNSVSAADARLR